MKHLVYTFTLLFIGLSACTEYEKPKNVPFKMLPNGLKKKVEAELIESMKKEVIEHHQELHEYYSSDYPLESISIDRRNYLIIEEDVIRRIEVGGKEYSRLEISDIVQTFYLTNEPLSREQTLEYLMDFKCPNYNFPFYTNYTKSAVLEQMRKTKTELQRAKDLGEEDFIIFYSDILDQWNDKCQILTSIGTNEFKEIHPEASIRIMDKGCKKGLSPLTFAAIEGMILVRNYASRKYFGISYEELYFRGSREIKSNDKSRLEAIDKLFPLKIFDLNYAKLNSMETGYVTPVPEV
ncbi:hypothetical protein N9L43_00330, partial [bacterium]|nr:hypothetical protein [bacterium]